MADVRPGSGRVIGLVLEAFGGPEDLPAPIVTMLRDRTSRRFFSGTSSRKWCCRLSALQFLLLERGLLSIPEVVVGGAERSIAFFSVAMASDVILWNEVARHPLRRRACLRYLALDAATRLGGLLDAQSGGSWLFDATPAWADRSRRGEPLRTLLSAAAPHLTNREHANRLGFTPSELSGWKTGKSKPGLAAISAIASYVRRHDVRGAAFVGRLLQWHYALSAIACAIAEAEGEAFAVEFASVLGQTLRCNAERLTQDVEPRVSDEHRLSLLLGPFWRLPAEAREIGLHHARHHGAGDDWERDVRDVCAAFEALRDPDELVRRKMPRHAHPFWYVPKGEKRAVLRALALARPLRGSRRA